jgi:polyphenol oxidase
MTSHPAPPKTTISPSETAAPGTSTPVESIAGMEGIPGVRAAFVCRSEGIDTSGERADVLQRLAREHRKAADGCGFQGLSFVSAQQVHGSEIAVVEGICDGPVPAVDGLITNRTGLCLAVYVADCAAIFLAEKHGAAVGLFHSGRKGTDLGMATRAVAKMHEVYGIDPCDLVASLSPCIRPPNYEEDFAASIRDQLTMAGVGKIHDPGICTATHPSRYYSYRREKGRTGRMLALLAKT